MFGGRNEVIANNVFSCGFKCGNCFHEWTQQFRRGIEVTQKGVEENYTNTKKEPVSVFHIIPLLAFRWLQAM